MPINNSVSQLYVAALERANNPLAGSGPAGAGGRNPPRQNFRGLNVLLVVYAELPHQSEKAPGPPDVHSCSNTDKMIAPQRNDALCQKATSQLTAL